ncbi:hypothetical protein AB0D08_00700 [Kitasatospora sp. NPDC048540]|uniref:DUF7144 family membrane protein n=1 Tax=unclassified Kitasatospora TaxID=2633591 RepID=UPI000A7574CA|nr:hypothetical protein [Kitasatospora sp. MBT63]
MSTASGPTGPPPTGSSYDSYDDGENTAWVTGLVLFAAVMLLVNGILEIFQGIMAIADDDLFVTTPRYVFRLDLTSWGWIHLVLGVLITLTGLGLLRAATWARIGGIFFASLSAIAAFLSLPYYPLWSLVLLAIDVFVIWALCVYHKEPAF